MGEGFDGCKNVIGWLDSFDDLRNRLVWSRSLWCCSRLGDLGVYDSVVAAIDSSCKTCVALDLLFWIYYSALS